jgi:hypothetical protein
MLEFMRNVRFTALAAAIYAVASLTIGFAHGPGPTAPGAGAPTFAAEISALALPDGTNVPICSETSRAPAPKSARKNCAACRLMAASSLPPAPSLESCVRPFVVGETIFQNEAPEPPAAPGVSARPRGPPSLS